MHNSFSFSPQWPSRVVGTVTSLEEWERMDSFAGACDILEWRVDCLSAFLSVREMLAARPVLPVLVTVRDASEGGVRTWTQGERREWYRALMPVASAIDVEIAFLADFADVVGEARQAGVTVIASAHDFAKPFTEAEMRAKMALAVEMGADVVKFAHRLTDVSHLLTGEKWLSASARGELPVPVVLMGMGSLGPVSRLLYAQLGTPLVYGYLGEEPSAPGQLPAGEFKNILGRLSPWQD